jgi:hypothetical protein
MEDPATGGFSRKRNPLESLHELKDDLLMARQKEDEEYWGETEATPVSVLASSVNNASINNSAALIAGVRAPNSLLQGE